MNGKHELTIKNSSLEDAGVYTFVAKDVKSEAVVKVNGKLRFKFDFCVIWFQTDSYDCRRAFGN